MVLTPERSLAVDPRFIPYGAPVWLATTDPVQDAPLQRLLVAQDTGGAIRGPVRGDVFWGYGPTAEELCRCHETARPGVAVAAERHTDSALSVSLA